MNYNFLELKNIAADSLRACYADDKVLASPTHFSDFWARDTFWALPGMLAIGDYTHAKSCFRYFLSLQRSDGKIPRKVSRDINVIKYLFGKSIPRKSPRPTYHGLVPPFHAMDSELLLIIALEEYLQQTRDYDYAEESYMSVRRAMRWHQDRVCDDSGLMHEYFLGNWMDTVFKFGPVLYTNVLFARALEAMVTIAQIAGRDDEAQLYVSHAMKAKRAVRNQFYNENFFCDELRLKSRATFDLSGNVLAVLYGISDTQQSEKILTHIVSDVRGVGACVGAVPSGQKWWKINPIVRFLGIADYHTSTSWLWIDALVVRILHENGFVQEAHDMLTQIDHIAKRDGEIGETYFANGKPYRKRFWRSATPFAWSSGILLHVLTVCGFQRREAFMEKPEQRIC